MYPLRIRRVIAESRVDGVPFEIVADIEVEVAVVVEVGPCRRCRPVAIAAKPAHGGHVLEAAVSEVVIEGVGPPAGDEEVGPAVVVEVADGDAVAIAAGQRGQAGRDGDVLEPPVAAVAEEAVAERKTGRAEGETAPLNGVDVEPAIAVEIEQAHTAARWSRGAGGSAAPVIEREDQAAALGVIDERGYAQLRECRAVASCRRTKRPEEIGERFAAGRRRLGLGQPCLCGRGLSLESGVALGRDSPPGRGVEPPADPVGRAGQLGRKGRQLGLIDQPPIVAPCVLDIRLAASELGEPLALAVLRGQVGESLDGHGIGRLQGDQRLEGRSLGRSVATPCGHPGAELEHPGLGQARRGQMGRRADDLVGPAGGLSPVEPGAPDRGVVGPSALAPRQPVGGLLETPGAGRQVGQAKPDAVVVGQPTAWLWRVPAQSVNMIRVDIVLPQVAEDLGGIAYPLHIPSQQALPLIALARYPVDPAQQPPCLLVRAASRAAGGETRFCECVATGF